MTLTDALNAAFGKSAKTLDVSHVANYMNEDVDPFCLTLDDNGGIFVSCGGDVIGTFATTAKHTCLCFHVVINDDAGRRWDNEKNEMQGMYARGEKDQIDWKKWHSSRPRTILRVVASC